MVTRILTSNVTAADIRGAVSGDAQKLELVVKAVLHDAYGLALRFLWHPEDAEDATQEIAIRVVTGMSGFNERSSFRTWVYRIACNTLSTLAKRRGESAGISFETMSEELLERAGGPDESLTSSPYDAALVEEVKVGCTHAMLICLDRDHRLAYILGTILDIDHVEAARALCITAAAFRKRLSRANGRIAEFVASTCGIVSEVNVCRCEARVPKAIACGRVDATELKFSKKPVSRPDLDGVVRAVRQLEAARRAAELYRSHPDFDFSAEKFAWVKELLAPFEATGDPSGPAAHVAN
jgi:RNA polymerase sigma factor (sigma-70 family)